MLPLLIVGGLFVVQPGIAAEDEAIKTDWVTLFLDSGARVHGNLLQSKADRFVVDLGFTVLVVPHDRVEKLDRQDAQAVATEVQEGFFNSGSQSDAGSVQDQVDRWGEAVVEVRTPTSLGSGFLINEHGYVVTNAHVISGEFKISITLFRKTKMEMEKKTFDDIRIVASNAFWDLALLKIEGLEAPLKPAVILGDSDELSPGEAVFAIGSPLGLERTVSQGIVSQADREIGGLLYIQTTSQINPGNSGGPLFDLKGEVVGVNNMKLRAMGVEGMGFAIPVNWLKLFLKHRAAFAFDPKNPNAGFRYSQPPLPHTESVQGDVR